jgi:hypothetical protein
VLCQTDDDTRGGIMKVKPVMQYTITDGKTKQEYVGIEVGQLKELLAKLDIEYIEFEEDR